MFGQRRRRWANIESASGQYLVFTGVHFPVFVFNPFSAGTEFRRQSLTSKVGPRTDRVQCYSRRGPYSNKAEKANLKTMFMIISN